MVRSVVEGGPVRKRKVTPAERFRQELMGAVAGSQESFSGYCRLAAQAMLQSAMEVEATEFIGRTTYQRREDDPALYRNGYKPRRVATGEGPIALLVPQMREGVEPFPTRILEAYPRRSEILEALIPQLYVKGLSVRDVSDAMGVVFEDGASLLRRPAASDRPSRRTSVRGSNAR